MSTSKNRSTAALTPEQRDFLRIILNRATSPWGDVNAPKGADGKPVPIGQPFLAHILYSLIPVNAPDCETMGVDKYGRLYINFDTFMDESHRIGGVASATKALNHEPYHIMYKHNDRFEALPARDPETGHKKNHTVWNFAGDLTINQGIRHLVPDWALHIGEGQFEKFPANLTSEQYYKMIKDQEDVCPDCWQKNPESGSGDGQGSGGEKGDGQGSGSGQGAEGDAGEGQGSGDGGAGSPGEGQGSGSGDGNGHTCPGCGQETPVECGSGAGGEPGAWELGPDEAPVLEDYKLEDLRRATAEEIRRTEQSKPGTMPGYLRVWADETLKAPIPDWKSVLRAVFNKGTSWVRGKMDYSYTRPNRRNQNPGIILPALRARKVRIAVGVDTSGSNLHNLGIISKNIEELARQSGSRGRDFLAFGVDAVADAVQPVNSPSQVIENMRGGGGTDMRVAFEVFERLNKQGKADLGILLTDLETPWPKRAPKADMKYIVVGVVHSNDYSSHYVQEAKKAIGKWADLIIITPEQLEEKK